jgi:peptidoglycan/LPS O-acetylase OafA/YrhL
MYFDSDSARKPLRHLWSLGIEEQYYLRMAPTFAPRSFASVPPRGISSHSLLRQALLRAVAADPG